MTTAAPIRNERLRMVLRGAVQGVGFRPTVFRIATGLGLAGWARNTGAGLEIEIEGGAEQLDCFVRNLEAQSPPAAVVTSREISHIEPAGTSAGTSAFEILPSDETAARTAAVLPDLATCPECLRELGDPDDRRFKYAFTNCTQCGPRYSIQLDIPYDRPNTTMRDFTLCAACRSEYESPCDRRYHAQPNACAICGPRLWIEFSGEPSAPQGGPKNFSPDVTAIARAARALAHGKIIALKGTGGFHLLADARNLNAVLRLRQRKHREEKPFAVLMPSLAEIWKRCSVSAAEAALLLSPAAPIVLLRPRENSDLSPDVAKSSPFVGVMLPSSPIQHLLMAEYPHPVIATSGNPSDEPIAIENDEARTRLQGVADAFLMHNRPIARPCDDSVARISRGNPQILRRARGYAPLPVTTLRELPPVLAVGGHLKNTVAIAVGRDVFLSQHVGDLDTVESRESFERAIHDLCSLYRFEPKLVACDLHPDYASTRWAHASGLPVIPVQHHHAHVAACAAENGVECDYLGVAWDGTGYGLDATIWGGEFFIAREGKFDRVAHLRPFRLPGGETAIRDCTLPAASLLFETFGHAEAESAAGAAVRTMLERQVNSPITTSVGRLFDAVASFAEITERNRFEGQAAICLERAIRGTRSDESYRIEARAGVGDWAPLIEAVLKDRHAKTDAALISVRFHNALANWILEVALEAAIGSIVLSGGVFQNAYLTERTSTLLEGRGFRVFTHRQVPPNDGGIALGQAVQAGYSTI